MEFSVFVLDLKLVRSLQLFHTEKIFQISRDPVSLFGEETMIAQLLHDSNRKLPHL